jgi:hypothetical protein
MAVDVARDQRVDLDVFDVAGRRVATLHSGSLAAGRHSFRWTRDNGFSPGVYLVRLSTKEADRTVRVIRLN